MKMEIDVIPQGFNYEINTAIEIIPTKDKDIQIRTAMGSFRVTNMAQVTTFIVELTRALDIVVGVYGTWHIL